MFGAVTVRHYSLTEEGAKGAPAVMPVSIDHGRIDNAGEM
jgi:hypothetical protein